ncbi:MAG: D-ribose pyranase [Bifidobacterium tibiigranuli]|jgi:D-ribose pyranase|uniref:D-ribose pyranase n=1 Tax=Bifidobacterium tibiigranuli TaxID=2172043 RepID=UPI002357752D|nr:D-ribose pyranase [Bifidobacterium tibiigranuli]MCH3975598.1 D-ribose pyranase [Bifidobacterium tibiigranuli]MCH4189553.1 D-ribose pyranase [Bifidobacterium tibiigranuli]MCH4204467.1 D-ribose pyranase [Bifidobacterium tibiigranuli]MCH4275148.1 D-ribose pyranase [Bifidobacterium tibiigranuli]MCI1233201.1 D-ribose pyranase [Bifidobacterium tibiigranuli]
MLTHGILNAQLAHALAGLRHKDLFAISDCGLPVQPGIEVIDLAVTFGVPRFEQVLDALQSELILETGLMAQEAQGTVAESWVSDRFAVPLEYVPHDGPEGFKARVKDAKFVIRTGETTPYANVLFRCGVPF